MTQFQVRQGDVLIQKVKSIPKSAKPVKRDRGRIVLAYGEVTGHAHAIVPDVDDEFSSLMEIEGQRYLQLSRDVVLTHEEHAPVSLPKGLYRLPAQYEWSDLDEPLQVAD